MRRFVLTALTGLCWVSAQAAHAGTARPRVTPTPAQPATAQSNTIMTIDRGALKVPLCGFEPSGTVLSRPGAVKETTALKAYPMIGAIGDTVPVKATLQLRKTGEAVPGHNLHFTVDGQPVGTAKTDSTGTARVDYTVPNTMGAKHIKVTFKGTSLCTAASASADFGTVKSATNIELYNNMGGIPPHRGGSYDFRGKLTRITDKGPLYGRELLLYVDGKQVRKIATDSGGGFLESVDVPSKAPNVLEVKVQFEGDDLYVPSVGVIHENVTAPPYTAYLTWNDVTGKVGQTVTTTARLAKHYPYDGSGGVAGKTVRIWRERGANFAPPLVPQKDLGSGTTDASGKAAITFTIDDDPLPYSLYAHADDPAHGFTLVKKSDAQYVVQRAPVTLSVSGPGSGSIGSTVNFTVTVKRNTDGAPVVGGDVHVDYSAAVKTNASGQATVAYGVTSTGTGPRTLTFKVDEGARTEAGTKTLTFTATPNTN